MQLNEIIWNDQSLQLEERIARIQERFQNGSDAVRGQLLMGMNRYETILTREEENSMRIQDPPEMLGRRGRTFGRGGPCRPTGGEFAENDLRRYDRTASTMRNLNNQESLLLIFIPPIDALNTTFNRLLRASAQHLRIRMSLSNLGPQRTCKHTLMHIIHVLLISINHQHFKSLIPL
jgi:hypothetical protein